MGKENFKTEGLLMSTPGEIIDIKEGILIVKYRSGYDCGVRTDIFSEAKIPIAARNIVGLNWEGDINWRPPKDGEENNFPSIDVGAKIFFNFRGWVSKEQQFAKNKNKI